MITYNKKQNWPARAVLFIALVLFISGCKEVQELFEVPQPPVLSSEGIILSKDRVFPLDTIRACIKADNPLSGPMQFEWWASGGQFVMPNDKDTVYWVAPQNGGNFTIYVRVSNSSSSVETHKDIFVSSTALPLVDISIPLEGSYFTLEQNISVQASAVHDNGIASVRLSVHSSRGDSVIDTLALNSTNIYRFSFVPWEDLTGEVSLTVTARAANNLGTEGTDKVNIYIEGFISGDHGE